MYPANDNDVIVFTCRCASQLFYITPDGPQCGRCGELKTYEEVWG